MARPKLPDDQRKETIGIKLPPEVIETLNTLAEEQDRKPSAIGRDMLLLGLSVTEQPTESIEEVLKNAQFFHAKGLSDADLEVIRPILEALDKQIERLTED